MSKRIPFNVKFRPQIESGDYKVETRDGKPVRIICWDMDSYNQIVALVANYPNYNGSLSEHIFSYGIDGRYSAPAENAEDLFIVTPEPEMTEFEFALRNAMSDTVALSEDREDYEVSEICDKQAKKYSAELLALAKQQLLQSGELLTQEHHEQLMETLREECKKDLPRWRNVEPDKRYVGCVTRYMDVNGDWNYCMSSGMLSDDCQYISIAALEKLPQEDESHE